MNKYFKGCSVRVILFFLKGFFILIIRFRECLEDLFYLRLGWMRSVRAHVDGQLKASIFIIFILGHVTFILTLVSLFVKFALLSCFKKTFINFEANFCIIHLHLFVLAFIFSKFIFHALTISKNDLFQQLCFKLLIFVLNLSLFFSQVQYFWLVINQLMGLFLFIMHIFKPITSFVRLKASNLLFSWISLKTFKQP